MTTTAGTGASAGSGDGTGGRGWFAPSAAPGGDLPQGPAPVRPPNRAPAAPAPATAPPAFAVGGVSRARDAELTRRTLEEVMPVRDEATSYFYALLFVHHPHLRDLFPASMEAQRDRLFRALLDTVGMFGDRERLARYAGELGRGHRKYGTRPEHYPAIGECLLTSLARHAPLTWDAETEAAWARAYTDLSQLMIDAASADEQRAPAWWFGEITGHQLRTPDVAVVTVRPDRPYPFLAGQFAAVETPWWPRVWRHYSFASAPRGDGQLTFHVKAVPAGWVSGALVHRAAVGDVLRLGPPAGTMTVDHTTDDGLVCLGGGTGIAPIKALVEDVAGYGRIRPVEVFYGARSDHDLYDLDTLLRLEREHRWLSVRPVVSFGPGPSQVRAFAGQVPDAVRQHGPWASYDGYLSGPPGMIRSGLDALLGSGIPAGRIRHDAIDERVAG